MTDDDLLGRLRDAAREQDVLADPRWEAFARGELSPDEEQAFRRHAEGAGLGDDVFAALRPSNEEALDELINSALREVAAAHVPAAPSTADPHGPPQ